MANLTLDCFLLCPSSSQVDQSTGTRGKPKVLLALAQYRRHNGRMHFGILLTANELHTRQGMRGVESESEQGLRWFRVGDTVCPHS